jgi:hypothetical protein
MTQLQRISGVVKNLKVSKNYEDFVFTTVDKNIAGTAAIGAAAVDLLFNSTALASISGGAEISIDCFACTVQNELLVGRFHQVQFKNEDEIEFVIERTSSGNVVHAARSPSKRLLWMMPYQLRGYVSQRKSNWKWSLIFSASAALVGASFFHWGLPRGQGDSIADFFIFFGVVFGMIFTVIFWAFSRLYGHSEQATKVISALGYNNPKNVDLPTFSKIAEKRIKKQTGKHPGYLSPWSFWY